MLVIKIMHGIFPVMMMVMMMMSREIELMVFYFMVMCSA